MSKKQNLFATKPPPDVGAFGRDTKKIKKLWAKIKTKTIFQIFNSTFIAVVFFAACAFA
jgi:hypothetical protein